MSKVTVRPLEERDRPWLITILHEYWHSTRIVSRGVAYDASKQHGFIAEDASGALGLLIFTLIDNCCEVLTLNSFRPDTGVGSQLLHAVQEFAREAGCKRLWLTTTNDNTRALRFYQRRGWQLVAYHPGAIDRSRREIKPEIPLLGDDDIPMRDEFELEFPLKPPTQSGVAI